MFHLVDFQVTIAEILIIIMRTFRIAIWNLDVIISSIVRQLFKPLTKKNYSELDDEEPMEIDYP
ncbi:ORF6 [Betacoronavirus sp. RsYN09]|uniref:ORF6 protein n=1 Tax=Horseshoe bat sarbecovirus TaxID=3068538 RepID=A0AA49X5N8_9BETC|nr:ORF6 [Betacoronavirus sp. RsYN09]WEG19540.1 ORF6 protein [Severe acute respiratory syndrome-related coronavirus]WLJ60521.1 ORF6 protein [Horseshoe bat sarbecovirus]WMT59630.1 ORF6 protein [Horseshoe bat sarbecovirus]